MNSTATLRMQFSSTKTLFLTAALGVVLGFGYFWTPDQPKFAFQGKDSTQTTGDSLKTDSTGTFVSTIQKTLFETRRIVKRQLANPARFINEHYIIVVDPGHGGTRFIDKGFSATYDGKEYYEKDIAWDYALLVQKKLIEAGYEGVTKTKEMVNDTSLSIFTRAGRAAKAGKDAGKKVLFVSLHWNNFEDKNVHGTEIYIKESNNYKSRKLAEYIRGTLGQIMEMHGAGENVTGIIERDYRVLRELDTGVLIELGYASNDSDLLKMLNHQDEIAASIVQGIDAFSGYLQEQDAAKNLAIDEDPKKKQEDYNLSQIPSIPFGWSWKKKDIIGPVDDVVRRYKGIYEKSTTEKEIVLTFDCGYENGLTPVILDILKENNVKAAFFITGGYLKQAEGIVQRMVNEGHIVGNHSVNHLSMPQLSVKEMKKEVLGLEREFYDRFEKKMNYFRPPSGEWSRRTLAVVQSLGYRMVFWSFAYEDWDTANQHGKDFAYKKIMANIRPGVVILLHSVSKDNSEALDSIIKDLKKDGYQFKSLDDIN